MTKSFLLLASLIFSSTLSAAPIFELFTGAYAPASPDEMGANLSIYCNDNKCESSMSPGEQHGGGGFNPEELRTHAGIITSLNNYIWVRASWFSNDFVKDFKISVDYWRPTELITSLSGSMLFHLIQNDEYTALDHPFIDIRMGGLPTSAQAKMGWTLTVVPAPAVPLPAAAFLFAPALLGFMGLRRKAKNSVA